MKVIVALEHRFVSTPDGAIWTESQFPQSFWMPYLLDLKLVLVGDGKHQEQLEAQVKNLCLEERVCFRGRLASSEAVRRELAQSVFRPEDVPSNINYWSL